MATLTPTEFHAMVLDYMRMVEATTRRLALEEAAKACEERARGHFQMSPAAAECDECAAACRALAAKESVL